MGSGSGGVSGWDWAGGLGEGLVRVRGLSRGAPRQQDQAQGQGKKASHTGCSSIFW